MTDSVLYQALEALEQASSAVAVNEPLNKVTKEMRVAHRDAIREAREALAAVPRPAVTKSENTYAGPLGLARAVIDTVQRHPEHVRASSILSAFVAHMQVHHELDKLQASMDATKEQTRG